MNNQSILQIIDSWSKTEHTLHSNEELLKWVSSIEKSTFVQISKTSLEKTDRWRYYPEKGYIARDDGSFFRIGGIKRSYGSQDTEEQPIIVQPEIGYLGIICKMIGDTLYFLMQAKIEPGNVNTIQISPTLQATKSNFMRSHGGKTPLYFDHFNNSDNHEIIVDQIQSEQSSRFYKKRNRNIIIKVNEDIEELPAYRWMTLGQIKYFMRRDNMVNMDTRTVISCIPFALRNFSQENLFFAHRYFENKIFFNSVFLGNGNNDIQHLFHYINNEKMGSFQS